MQTIDAINEMIGYVGESPIDATDSDYASHPLYESALRILNSTSRKVQSKGWWFNTRKTTLTPVADAIAIDSDVFLSVAVLDLYRVQYAVRDGALFNLTDNTAVITTALQAIVRELIAFDDLDELAAEYIKQAAALRFVRTYDGDRSKLSEVKEEVASSYALMNAEHIRQSKVNLFETQSMGPIMATTWYTRYRQR